MRYDPGQPLVFIHVPKTGGRSARQVFAQWFPNLILHYWPERPAPAGPRDVVFGHFNRCGSFGLAEAYPNVRQFMTILRDPFEIAVSRYFFKHRKGRDVGKLEEFLVGPLGSFDHFPVEVTDANYRAVIDSFLCIGFTDRMDESLCAMAAMLGKAYVPAPRLNVSERTTAYEHLRALFDRHHPLERAAYEYALVTRRHVRTELLPSP